MKTVSSHLRAIVSFFAVTTVSLLSPESTLAQSTTWTTDADGDWSVGANWSNGEPNGNTFDAVIDEGDFAVTVTLDVSRTINNLSIGGNDELSFSNNNDLSVEGGITNDGTISLNSTASGTDLILSGTSPDLTLSGTGTLMLGTHANNRILGSGTLTNSSTHTISGGGQIGFNGIGIANEGLIDANLSSVNMVVDPSALGLTNSGTMQASNGGILLLDGTTGEFTNTGGLIQALAGSEVQLFDTAAVTGGTFSTTGSGVIRVNASENAFFTDIINNGTIIGDNNTDLGISGTITNSGTMTMNAVGSSTDIEVQTGGATLTGGGTVTLNGANAGINGVSGGPLLTNVNNTIQGEGNLGRNTIAITNQAGGLIDANVNGGSLIVDPSSAGLIN